MSFHRVFADKKFGRDLAVAQALGNQLQNFQLARRDAQAFAFFCVGNERFATGGAGRGDRRRYRNFLHHNRLACFGQLQAQPNAQHRENRGGEATVNFDGVVDDQEAVLGPLQHRDQDSADQPVNEDMTLHSFVKKFFLQIIAGEVGRQGRHAAGVPGCWWRDVSTQRQRLPSRSRPLQTQKL